MPLTDIRRQDAGKYRCTADNGIESPATKDVWIAVQYSVEATASGENVTVARGVAKAFTCPVDGNPEPRIEWYNNKTGRKISSGKQLEARESGCYTCVASNSLGTSVNITQCLIILHDSSTIAPSTTVSGICESSTKVPSTTVSGETANITTVISKSPSPSYAVEGKNFTLDWTYTIDGTIGSAQITIVKDSGRDVLIGRGFSPGTITVLPGFKARFRAQVTETRAELTILAVQRSDEEEYILTVLPTGAGSIIEPLILVVNFQPIITEILGNQTVTEGGNATLKCLADGKPTPNITWTRLSDNSVVIMPLTDIRRQDAGKYRCTADNGIESPATKDVWIAVQYSVEATASGENVTVARGVAKAFTCPVDGNPEPRIEWYNNKTGRKISSGKQLEARESGCYTCVASNSLGTSVNITQCLIILHDSSTIAPSTTVSGICESSTKVPSTTVSGGQELQAILTIVTNYDPAFKDLNSASSKQFVAKFEDEMDKVYMNMPEYVRTEVTQLRPGSVIVYFILYFKTAMNREKGIENLRVTISSNGTFGDFQAKDLFLNTEESTKSATPTENKCSCSNNETTLLVIIVILVIIIILLIVIIIWQQTKLRIIGNKSLARPYEVPEERDAGFCDNETVMKNVNYTHLRPSTSTQEQIPDELAYIPLRRISSTGKGSVIPVSPAPNVEYAPLDIRTLSWEVGRNDVKVEKIIGKGAFGQVAKGTAKNLLSRSGVTTVAIKMVKANAPESDKRDLRSELELMKTLKPHPHVIRLLGCVTESEPLLVLIEYVPYGDLLGYLRKSRGLDDTYYKDPDIKPKTSLTSQQLMKFAWQIADGMSYLSLRKVVHRDLAARNVLVGERETCKITDFGMARDVQQENIYERKTKGRLPVKWTAYESLLYGQYTTKSDAWSYGVVLYEISTIGGSPYPRMEGRKIANLLQQGYRMPKPDHVDDDLYQIMMNCWQSEPEARPSFSDLTQQLQRMENQHKRLINMHIYDNALYANLEDLNA
ncbi:fibroblast growth factor receptor 2-like isoform X4 [Acropora muricata]